MQHNSKLCLNGYVVREIYIQMGTNDKDKLSNEQQIRCSLHCRYGNCKDKWNVRQETHGNTDLGLSVQFWGVISDGQGRP